MIANVHIPYGFGDCIYGFSYDGVITEREYIQKMIKDYNDHKYGVDEMMTTSFTHNIARNNYTKENNKYRQQKQEFGELKCYIDDSNFEGMTLEKLLEYYDKNKGFVIVVRIANKRDLIDNPDIETDLKSWQTESVKIDRIKSMSSIDKFKSLSKKDLKLTFSEDSKMAAILKECKMVNVYNNTKFALWVDKIIFINDKK